MPSSAAARSSTLLASSTGFRLRRRQGAPGILLQLLDPVLALLGEKFVERDEHRRLVVLARLDGEHAALGGLDREAHDGLVDRADLLDVEGPVGQPLALRAAQLQGHQPFEDAQQAPVRHGQDPGRLILRGAPLEEWEFVRIEQLAAARLNEAGPVAFVDQPKQRQQAAPAAAPLVHRVGIERASSASLA